MYANILLAVDLDEPRSLTKALPVATRLARCFSARLTLCTVVRDVAAEVEANWSPIGYREMIDVARARLLELGATIDDLEIGVEVATGSIAGGILDAAARIGADLIVLGSHRPEMKDYLLGANASRVMRRAPCSVFVVRGEAILEEHQ